MGSELPLALWAFYGRGQHALCILLGPCCSPCNQPLCPAWLRLTWQAARARDVDVRQALLRLCITSAKQVCTLHDAACRLFRGIKWQVFQCACKAGLALAARCNCCANPFGHASLALNLKQEREITHARLQQAAPRLGTLGVRRRGIDVQEVCTPCSWCLVARFVCEHSMLRYPTTSAMVLTLNHRSGRAGRRCNTSRAPVPPCLLTPKLPELSFGSLTHRSGRTGRR